MTDPSARITSASTMNSQSSQPVISSPLSAGNVTSSADSGDTSTAAPSSNGTETDSLSGDKSTPATPAKIIPSASPALLEQEKVTRALASDSAIEVLLGRLKKSVNTCEEWTKYIRKRAILEEDHEEHLKKITRATQEALKNTGNLKQDSLTQGLEKLLRVDERIAAHTSAHSKQLFTMHDELSSMASTFSRNRKSIKENFKRKEREVVDSISAAEKAKSKYDQLCVELERVKTTDPSSKKFTLKGSKTTSEQEEILLRKIEAADSDYRQKVSTSTGLRNVFLNNFRPSTVKQLKDLIIEIDIAMSLQLQKYATQTEDVVLQTALSISPMAGSNIQSVKVIASSIDNEKDLSQYILKNLSGSQSNKQLIPVEYRQHPSMAPAGNVHSLKPKAVTNLNPNQANANKFRNVSGQSDSSSALGASVASPSPFDASNGSNHPGNRSSVATPSLSENKSVSSTPYLDQSSIITGPRPQSVINAESVPLPPGTQSGFKTFGTPITDLIEFEGEMVPSVVRQCIYVVDKYGAELEGIYRTSGNIATVNSLKEMIDKDPSNIKLILPNPNSITDSDIYAVASLLKNYFSSLPEALLTNTASPQFLEHVKIPEPDVRLKRIHQVVYDLPDSSYWTLRSLIFHLAKIASKQDINLMSQRNLGIIWGPTLFPKGDLNASDMSYQGKLVEELIIHASDIFEAE